MKKRLYIILIMFSFLILFTNTGIIPVAASSTASPVISNEDDGEDDDMEERICGANVLIYEDPDADLRLIPRVKRAARYFGFDEGNVVWTGRNLPEFTRQLQQHKWDLVIVAVESRWTVELGETGLFDLVYDHLEQGGALIVETWNLDEDESALSGLVLDVCDAKLEKDWWRDNSDEDFERYDYMISKNPDVDEDIFEDPYLDINMPIDPIIFWDGDAGDFIRLESGSESEILAEVPSPDHDYGLLTSCLSGRFLLQTFSTHDYSIYETTKLWQNMMRYTLKNHFIAIDDEDYGDLGYNCEDGDECDGHDDGDDHHDGDDHDDCNCDEYDDHCSCEVHDNWFVWDVEEGDTCESISDSLEDTDDGITEEKLMEWNDLDEGDCENLEEGTDIYYFVADENLDH